MNYFSLFFLSPQQFKNNVSKVNGGKDFDEDMLEEIFTAIRYGILMCGLLFGLFCECMCISLSCFVVGFGFGFY